MTLAPCHLLPHTEYFRAVIDGSRNLFNSDRVLWGNHARSNAAVQSFANNRAAFFTAFAKVRLCMGQSCSWSLPLQRTPRYAQCTQQAGPTVRTAHSCVPFRLFTPAGVQQDGPHGGHVAKLWRQAERLSATLPQELPRLGQLPEQPVLT